MTANSGAGHGGRRGRARRPWRLLGSAIWLLPAAVAGVAGSQPAAPPTRSGAPPATVEELAFEPRRFHVGDRVTARVVVRSSRQLTAPLAVAPGDWVVVHGVETVPRSDGRWEVRVGFSSYRPGVLTLPPIDVGAFRLENIRVQAASLLPRDGDPPATLRPPRPQMLLPGTGGALLAGGIAVLVVPYLLVGGILTLTRSARRWQEERARALPRARLERAVRRLQAGSPRSIAAAAETVSFYAQLSHLARGYLAARLRIPAHASTTRELRTALPARGLPSALGVELTAILDTADRVKFAGRHSSAAEMQALSERLVTLVRAIDAELEGDGKETHVEL